MIWINDKTRIDENLISFKFSRSGGPGGQHVNKVNTRVELFFDFENCDTLSDFQKQRVRSKLKKRIASDGSLRIVSQQYRSQSANRNAAVDMLVEELAQALKVLPKRKRTKVPKRSKRRRLENKKKRSELKKLRGNVDPSSQ